MSHLRRLWFGMLTSNMVNSGTNSPIALIVNQNGKDRLHQTFSDTPQNDQEQGRANLYELNVLGKNIRPNLLNHSSIRVGIRGNDLWRPEHMVVWGEQAADSAIKPLAIETSLDDLSTDAGEGNVSVPLRLVGLGSPSMEIRRLLVLMTTENAQNAGTDSTVELLINTAMGGFIAEFEFPNTPQDEQEQGQANWYFAPVPAFRKNDLGDESIRLRILGSDAWLPASFFLFGLDDAAGRPESLVPLVHIRTWPHGWMSTDSSEGVSIVTLEQV